MLVEFKDFMYGGTVKVEICSLNGKVIEIKSLNETHLHSHSSASASGNGSAYSSTSVSSSNSRHDDIFFVDEHGEEHHVKLIDTDISIRAGHQVQFIWLKLLDTPDNAPRIKMHGRYSLYIIRYNRSMDTMKVLDNDKLFNTFIKSKFSKFCKKHLKLSLSIFVCCFLLMCFVSYKTFVVYVFYAFLGVVIQFIVQSVRSYKKQCEEFDTVLKPAISKCILPPVKKKVTSNKENQQYLPTY